MADLIATDEFVFDNVGEVSDFVKAHGGSRVAHPFKTYFTYFWVKGEQKIQTIMSRSHINEYEAEVWSANHYAA
jgi:hypothetical protein